MTNVQSSGIAVPAAEPVPRMRVRSCLLAYPLEIVPTWLMEKKYEMRVSDARVVRTSNRPGPRLTVLEQAWVGTPGQIAGLAGYVVQYAVAEAAELVLDQS